MFFDLASIFAVPIAIHGAAVGAFTEISKPVVEKFEKITDVTSAGIQIATSPTADTGIVLVARGLGGVGRGEGREGNVFAKDSLGRWGAVCGNWWSRADADVVCKQLGFTRAVKHFGVTPALLPPPAIDGPGSQWGPLPSGFSFVLQRVDCAGSESKIFDCPILASAAVPTGCDVDTVAGVECS